MALADLSFKFWTDTGLTVSFSNLFQVINYTDLSDNPQDFVLYFGSASTAGTKQLRATSNPGVDNITLTPTDNLTAWQTAHAYTVGTRIEPTTPNTYVYQCSTAGTSHATTEPTWPTTPIGTTVSDGTAVWTLMAKKHPITEIKMASTSGGLAGATAGAAFNLGTQILSGAANRVPVYIRITNSVTTVSDDTGYPEISLNINSVNEEPV